MGGACCPQYCSSELRAAGHYCGSDGCDCGVCPGRHCAPCRSYDDDTSFADPTLEALEECSGACCPQYCSSELRVAGHYCGSDGCDCGVCPGRHCAPCRSYDNTSFADLTLV